MRHVLISTTLLLAVACGGGDGGGDDPAASPSGPPVVLAGTVNDRGARDAGTGTEVELGDFYFAPTFLKAAPRSTVALQLRNSGEAPHTFTVTELGVDVTVQPGATGEASVTLPASGAVRFFCRFHEAQGMQGAFYFVHGDTVGPGAGTGGTGTTAPAGGDGAYNQ